MLNNHLDGGRINKFILIRNVIIFWGAFYMTIQSLFLLRPLSYSMEYRPIKIFSLPIVAFLSVYLCLYIAHHIQAKSNLKKGILFAASPGDRWLERLLTPAGVRKGTLISIRLNCYLKEVRPSEWGNKLFNFVLTQKCSGERPLIVRSHLLSLPATRTRLIRRLEKQGFNCSVRPDLPIGATFRLLWLTPATILACQLYLPVICDSETEIVITPATSN